ncbi:hypothetical protein PCAR4_570012 [Paraburkholderia caribensis]|nr:hypothetical protein PCAR4_570012 [Paraburkholderia caribensis]
MLHVQITDRSGSSWIVGGPPGGSEIVETLPRIWKSVERMSGRTLTPLDDAFIEAFSSGSS